LTWLQHDSLVDEAKYSKTDWFIVFEEGDMPWFWTKFLKKGIKHCYAIRFDGFNWVAFYPSMGHTDVEILPFGHLDTIQNVSQDTNRSVIIHAKVRRNSIRIRAPWPTVFTCVEQIKALLGIRCWYVFTAWQLFKYLRRQNYGHIQKT